MAEGSKKQFEDAIKELFKEWKKTQDKETLKIIMSMQRSVHDLTTSKRQGQMAGEAAEHNRAVRSHIERRAQLREKTSMNMPNIAGVLAGGAESPIAGLGRMQRQASKPFKGVYEYQKSEGRIEELKGKKAKDRSKDEKEELKRLLGDREGMKKRAGSGFGKNLMGKRMQGMIGKVGKFMDSSKGQGMMAGGMMGASILTMIIKKAMEASPMLQQMLKIMNVAMTLFLRPIGDFIGGMLKPIMLFFLREIAVPMLEKGKNFIKFGEAFGKNILGFLLKPVETLVTAITLAMNPMLTPLERIMHENFDGVKEWMSEKKMNMIAEDILGEGATRQDLKKMIVEAQNQDVLGLGNNDRSGSQRYGGGPGTEGWDAETWAKIEAEFGTGADLTGMGENAKSPLDQFRQLMKDVNENTYTYVKASQELNIASAGVAAGMGAVVTQFDSVSEATGRVVTALDLMAEKMGGGNQTQLEVGGDVTVTSTGGTTVDTGAGEMADRDYSDIYGTEEDNQPAWVTKLKHWSNAKMYDTPGKMLAAFGQQVRPMMKTGGEQDPKKLAEYNMITKGGTISVAEGIQAHFEKIERLTELMGTDMTRAELNVNGLVGDTDDMLSSTVKMTNNLAAGSEATAEMWKKIQAAMSSMKNQRRYVSGTRGDRNVMSDVYNSSGSGYFKAMVSGGISLQRLNTAVQNTSRQHGGMINEPIWGVGASGRSYTFGEAGPEMITPMNKAGGGIGPVTINVNVDNINSDVDLEKIKPVIERALHEVHARRGII